MVSWEKPPAFDEPHVQTREEIAAELAGSPGEWAIVARHDRVARAQGQVERIESGREYGQGFAAVHRRVGNEHRVYAQKLRGRR